MSRTRHRLHRSAAEPESGIRVRPYAVGFTSPFTFPKSRSTWHALVYASSGVMSVYTPAGAWVVPPHRAVWIPAGVEYVADVSAGLTMRTLYFHPRLMLPLPSQCCVVNVPPLLRELVLHTIDIGMLNRTIPAHARLIGVLVDLLRELPTVALQLPQPSDPRARRAAELVAANPRVASLRAIAKHAGASSRTIQRLFAAETALTFARWRERYRLLHALRLLAAGDAVTHVAMELGYGSPSAFAAMFRRAFGTTPSRYFRDQQQPRREAGLQSSRDTRAVPGQASPATAARAIMARRGRRATACAPIR